MASPFNPARSGSRCSTTAPAARRRRSPCRTAWSTRPGAGPATTPASREVSRPTSAARITSSCCQRISRTATSPPSRWIADASGSTAYLGFNGFSRRWTEGPGAGLGHLWKTTDGGLSWLDVSGNLPDIPVNDIVISSGKLVVGTDLGAGRVEQRRFDLVAARLEPAVYDGDGPAPGPDQRLYAATHGRGIWSIVQP